MANNVHTSDLYELRLVYKDYEDTLREETVSARKVGEHFELASIPVFSSHLAIGDLVSVENDDGILYFDELIRASGNSTVQIVFFDPSRRPDVMKEIEKFGCGYGGESVPKYLAVDIPNHVNYGQVKKLLTQFEDRGILDYREACLSDHHRQEGLG